MNTYVGRSPRLVTLILLTALSLLSLNMFLPSLPQMARDFESDYSLVSLSIAGYLVVTAFLQLIIGPLSDRVGRRPVILLSLSIFALASIVCAVVTDIQTFLVFRGLQGAVIAGSVLSRAIVRDISDNSETARMLSLINMAMSIAPILGPFFGGVLDEVFGWRSNFVIFSVFGTALLMLCWWDLAETNKEKSGSLSQQFRMYPDLLQAKQFWAYALCGTFSTGAFYAFLAGVPLIAVSDFGMSPAVLGLSIGSTTVGFFIGSFSSGRFARKASPKEMMLVGQIIACAGLGIGILSYALGAAHVGPMLGAAILVGVGNGLTMPHALTGSMSVNPALAGTASGLSGALIIFGGAIITTVTAGSVNSGGVVTLLMLMFFCSAGGLACGLLTSNASEQLQE